jgi:hypothetical protein
MQTDTKQGEKKQQIKQKVARLLDLLDTKRLSNAEKEEKVQNCGAATVVAYCSGAPACTCLSLSRSLSRVSRLSSVHSFARLRHVFFCAAPPRSPTSFVSFTHLPSFLTPFLPRAKHDRHGWTRRYARRPKPRSTRFGDRSNLASGTQTLLG